MCAKYYFKQRTRTAAKIFRDCLVSQKLEEVPQFEIWWSTNRLHEVKWRTFPNQNGDAVHVTNRNMQLLGTHTEVVVSDGWAPVFNLHVLLVWNEMLLACSELNVRCKPRCMTLIKNTWTTAARIKVDLGHFFSRTPPCRDNLSRPHTNPNLDVREKTSPGEASRYQLRKSDLFRKW